MYQAYNLRVPPQFLFGYQQPSAPEIEEDFYFSPNYVRNLPPLPPPPYPGVHVPPERQPHIYDNPSFVHQHYPIASIGLHAEIRNGNIHRRRSFRIMTFAVVSTILFFVTLFNIVLFQTMLK